MQEGDGAVELRRYRRLAGRGEVHRAEFLRALARVCVVLRGKAGTDGAREHRDRRETNDDFHATLPKALVGHGAHWTLMSCNAQRMVDDLL